LGTKRKANFFNTASHVKGIVSEKVIVRAKQPISAIRNFVRLQLINNGKKIKDLTTKSLFILNFRKVKEK